MPANKMAVQGTPVQQNNQTEEGLARMGCDRPTLALCCSTGVSNKTGVSYAQGRCYMLRVKAQAEKAQVAHLIHE